MKSYSQAGQDVFAWIMCEKKNDGYFLDIGCQHESSNSNSYGLELLGWTGLLIDKESGCENRKSFFLKCDAAANSPKLQLAYQKLPSVVDYLSLDVDDATIPAMHYIPWHRVTFRVITIEHDKYRTGKEGQLTIWGILTSMGYERICTDVVADNFGEFEDWYVMRELIDGKAANHMVSVGRRGQDIVA